MTRDLKLSKYRVYRAISPSGKSYIGLTKNTIGERWEKHCADKRPRKLRSAILKYGASAFKLESLGECSDYGSACEFEKRMIKHYDTMENGYNMTIGGDGVIGKPLSDEHKAKLSRAHTGKKKLPFTKEHKKSMSNSRIGMEFSEEHRQNLSKSLLYNNRAAKKWCVTLPSGEIFTIINRVRFCLEHNLNYNSVNTSIQRGKSYKGYTFKPCTQDSCS